MVSVIVPVYNVEPYLARCLQSLASQTLEEIEVIVVNDGSPDRSQAIIDDFVGRYPDRFRSLVKTNGGLSSARNHGLENARGEYVGFVDGDDAVNPEMFASLIAKAEATDADIVVCGYMTVDLVTGARTYHRQGWAKHYGRSLSERPDYLSTIAPYVWNKIFRRSLFLESGVRFPQGKLFEDIPVTYTLLSRANRIEKVQRALYYYSRSRTDSITHSYSPRNLEMIETLAIMNEFYRAHGQFEEFREALLKINFKHVYNRLVELPRYDGLVIKQTFVLRSWKHMDSFFPGWRDDPALRKLYRSSWRFPLFTNTLLIKLYALSPALLHECADWVTIRRNQTRRFFKRFGAARRIRLQYAHFLRWLPVDSSVALFESFHGRNITDSTFYLMRDLARRGTHSIFVSTNDSDSAKRYLKRYGVDATLVRPGSRAYLKALASAGYLVNNVSFPPFLTKRPEQVYLNTWHGTPLKTLGKSMPSGFRDMPNIQGNFVKTDYLLFTNDFTRERMMQDYMLDNQYGGTPLVMGSPRNAVFLDRERESVVRSELGLLGKRILFYMPTWRGGSSRQLDLNSYKLRVEDHLAEIDAALDDDTVLFVKFHTLVSAHVAIDEYEHVRVAPADYETYDLLNIADCLITDYSSVFFDFALTRREILLFTYDIEEYIASRNLYMPLDSLPFPVFETAAELGAHLGARREFIVTPEYTQFVQRFAGLDGPDASKNLNDVALGLRDPNESGFVPRPVDLVFIPYLTKRGCVVLEELLASGYDRDDVVFVMSGHRHRARAGAYMYNLYKERGIDINYRVTSDRILLTLTTALLASLHRRFGWRFSALDRAYLQEARRLFGNTPIRSATDFSRYKKFSAMAEVIDRHADSGPI